jgi:hypothetical protein
MHVVAAARIHLPVEGATIGHERIVLVIELAVPLPSAYVLICATHRASDVLDIEATERR